MRFFKLLHITLFLIKKFPKIGIQGNNLHIFPWHLQDQKHFPKKSWSHNLVRLKKLMPKSQAKAKPSFPQYPFLTVFNPKKSIMWTNIQF